MKEHLLTSRIASDLFHVHNDRINTYMQLLREPGEAELDVKAIFERIIEESMLYKKQLKEKMKTRIDEPGEIYQAWEKMKGSWNETDKKSILAICAHDELVITNTYSLALSLIDEPEIKNLLEFQQQGLKQLHAHIQQYHDAQ